MVVALEANVIRKTPRSSLSRVRFTGGRTPFGDGPYGLQRRIDSELRRAVTPTSLTRGESS